MPSIIEENEDISTQGIEWGMYESEILWAAQRTSRPVDKRTTSSISSERFGLALANIRYLSDVIRQLIELREAEESDEYGTLRADKDAYETACQLVTDAAIVLGNDKRAIPRGNASTDAEGGVRIEWIRKNASVHLVVPAKSKAPPYVYHEVDGPYSTVAATAESLARWLKLID